MNRRVGCALLGLGAVLIGALVFGAATLRRSDGGGDSPEFLVREYTVGECITWDQSIPAEIDAKPIAVSCRRPHLKEVTGVFDLDDGRSEPTEAEWDELTEEKCLPATAAYLGHPVFDGHLNPIQTGSITPNHSAWVHHKRVLKCTISLRQPSLALHQRHIHPVLRTRVAQQPRLSPYRRGDCIRTSGKRTGTVPCTSPHQFEVTGVVDASEMSEEVPNDAAWERDMGPVCEAMFADYFGGSPPAEADQSFYRISADEWAADIRGVPCVAARYDGQEPRTLRRSLRP